jgi:hypothetical protein
VTSGCNLLISAFQVAEITSMNHARFVLWVRVWIIFCAGWTWTAIPLFCLLYSWDYRYASVCQSLLVSFKQLFTFVKSHFQNVVSICIISIKRLGRCSYLLLWKYVR